MARGWESKSVESQQESAAAARSASALRDDAQARVREQTRSGLELSRTRILRELAAAVHPRHREQLEAALRYLNGKIAEMDDSKSS
jgi:hypothetical protein